MVGCKENAPLLNSTLVDSKNGLQEAINNAEAGDVITLANGVYKDVGIDFIANGTEDAPIILKAETAGKVSLEGQSYLKFGGSYLQVEGLYFKNGFTPTKSIITFRINKDTLANHCSFSNCVIEDFNQLHRDKPDHWVEFWGRHNKMDHCYIAGKSNQGPTVRVDIKGNQNINNYHQITNNHFGPRPRKGGPKAETIQIGDSYTSMSPCYTTVANNLFEKCNGEVEVISSKTNFNEFRNNVFYKCEGSMVTRHGNYCTIDGNYFIGDESSNIGGVRIINTGHWITNNYFYNLRGKEFISPIAIMNGIPKSPLNRYNQVTDVVIAHNSWINCDSPLHFGVGTNISQKDVLPPSEIRSARPIRTVVANNIIYNKKGDKNPIVAHDKIDGVRFEKNIINNQNVAFEKIEGVEGNDRSETNAIGAIGSTNLTDLTVLDKKKYGASWFSNEKPEVTPETFTVSKASELSQKIMAAKSGDIIELTEGSYEVTSSMTIDKKMTIRSKNKSNKATIIYSGNAKTPAFELHPRGELHLVDMILKGKNSQYAFASLKENMSSLYNLKVSSSEISNFDYVLKGYKESFANEITFSDTHLKNCKNGIELSEETNDKGDYNVEFLTIENCEFENIKKNVIDYYRGGYDESTIGGNLTVKNSSFTKCGREEKNGILLNTRGIVNVEISNNEFKNNPVKLVALLWGAKNNAHSENKITQSGKLIVEENLKLKLVY